jgi:hypothetical protein
MEMVHTFETPDGRTYRVVGQPPDPGTNGTESYFLKQQAEYARLWLALQARGPITTDPKLLRRKKP